MPHQCTTCGHAFEDGSKEMLGGCPECGGTKFQFYPPGTDVPDEPPSDADPPERDDHGVTDTVGRVTTKARDIVSNGPDPGAPGDRSADVGTSDTNHAGPDVSDPGAPDPDAPDPNAAWPSERGTAEDADDGEIIDADAREPAAEAAEDDAQAGARRDVVAEDELSLHEPSEDESRETGLAAAESPPERADGRVVSEPSGEDPDLAELRQQLNDQFESIKIVEPGQYELNLMELYDREEYIIALQENGRYVIQVPENWMGDRE